MRVNLALDDHALQPLVVEHVASRGALVRVEVQHRLEEGLEELGFGFGNEVLVLEDRVERPELELVDVLQLACVSSTSSSAWSMRRLLAGRTFPGEDVGAELARERDTPRERSEQLDDLRNVVVVLVVPRARMGVEQVVACQQLEELRSRSSSALYAGGAEFAQRTIADADQMSTAVPHFAPRIASGERYCLVWMSFVKCKSVQLALPKSAILTVMRSRLDGSYGAGGGRVFGSPATMAGWRGLCGIGRGGEVEIEPAPSGGGERIVTSESLLLFEEGVMVT